MKKELQNLKPCFLINLRGDVRFQTSEPISLGTFTACNNYTCNLTLIEDRHVDFYALVATTEVEKDVNIEVKTPLNTDMLHYLDAWCWFRTPDYVSNFLIYIDGLCELAREKMENEINSHLNNKFKQQNAVDAINGIFSHLFEQ